MKGKRYTTEHKIRILREADRGGKSILDICLPIEEADESAHRLVRFLSRPFLYASPCRPGNSRLLLFQIRPDDPANRERSTPHRQPFGNHVKEIGRAGPRLFLVVTGDAATGDDPAMHPQSRERRFERFASYIIEIGYRCRPAPPGSVVRGPGRPCNRRRYQTRILPAETSPFPPNRLTR